MTVPTTTLGATVRTITAKSISGNEIPYIQTDSQSIILNQTNIFSVIRNI